MDTQQFVWLRQQPSDAQHMQALQAQLVAGFAHLTHNDIQAIQCHQGAVSTQQA